MEKVGISQHPPVQEPSNLLPSSLRQNRIVFDENPNFGVGIPASSFYLVLVSMQSADKLGAELTHGIQYIQYKIF